ncbi:hypothetical protein Plhal710r2_c002g0003831 [Plasmopara halstedii]
MITITFSTIYHSMCGLYMHVRAVATACILGMISVVVAVEADGASSFAKFASPSH